MMNWKECRATRREIDESELNQTLSQEARLHVAECASCRDFRAERTSLRELVGSLEPVAAPRDFDLRLRARLASERQSRARRPFIFGLVIGTPAITAAALVLMLVVMVWLAQRNRNQAPAVASVPSRQVPAVPNQTTPAYSPVAPELREGPSQISTDVKLTGRQNREGNSYREINRKSDSAGINARDYGASPAESIKQIEQKAGEVSLSAPLKPMVVSMEDDRGAKRRISLPPVSFGAQRMMDSRTPVSFTSNSRSW
jgi:hypothetical protein